MPIVFTFLILVGTLVLADVLWCGFYNTIKELAILLNRIADEGNRRQIHKTLDLRERFELTRRADPIPQIRDKLQREGVPGDGMSGEGI